MTTTGSTDAEQQKSVDGGRGGRQGLIDLAAIAELLAGELEPPTSA